MITIKLLRIFIEIALWRVCSTVNFLHIFGAPFYKYTYERRFSSIYLKVFRTSCPCLQKIYKILHYFFFHYHLPTFWLFLPFLFFLFLGGGIVIPRFNKVILHNLFWSWHLVPLAQPHLTSFNDSFIFCVNWLWISGKLMNGAVWVLYVIHNISRTIANPCVVTMTGVPSM